MYSCIVIVMSTGDTDYENVDITVDITALPALMCLSIMLSDDSVIENTEQFTVVITSDDPAVGIDRMQSPIFIEDTTSRLIDQTPIILYIVLMTI
jgi:hypothetical protein